MLSVQFQELKKAYRRYEKNTSNNEARSSQLRKPRTFASLHQGLHDHVEGSVEGKKLIKRLNLKFIPTLPSCTAVQGVVLTLKKWTEGARKETLVQYGPEHGRIAWLC